MIQALKPVPTTTLQFQEDERRSTRRERLPGTEVSDPAEQLHQVSAHGDEHPPVQQEETQTEGGRRFRFPQPVRLQLLRGGGGGWRSGQRFQNRLSST